MQPSQLLPELQLKVAGAALALAARTGGIAVDMVRLPVHRAAGATVSACVTGLYDGGDPDNSRGGRPVHAVAYGSF